MAFTTVKEVDNKIELFIQTDPTALEDEEISNNTGGLLELVFITEVTYGKKIVLVINDNFPVMVVNPGKNLTITAAEQQAALDDGNHSDIYIMSRKGILDNTPNDYNKVRGGIQLPRAKTDKPKAKTEDKK
jgi:hypothetical protein